MDHKRLAKLADYLYNQPDCGENQFFAGRSLESCPVVFAKDWRFIMYVPVLFINDQFYYNSLDGARIYFDLDKWPQVGHLFVAGCQKPHLFGGFHLPPNPEPAIVGRLIREFLKHHNKPI